MKKLYNTFKSISIGLILLFASAAQAQHSVAMDWNETQLNCIRKDAARPTVQARNLFHASIVMYDAWAAFDDNAATVMLGQNFNGYFTQFNGIQQPVDRQQAQETAISYAMYRFLENRYKLFAPTAIGNTQNNWVLFMQGYCNSMMTSLGLDPGVTSTDYSDGDPAKLGNYIAAQMQIYALQDGSNQGFNYSNQFYVTVNGALQPNNPGNPNCVDPNRWQPLLLPVALDQNGFPVFGAANALSHEWGEVKPFALTTDQLTIHNRDGHDWKVYLDPGPPALLDTNVATGFEDNEWKWNYCLNIIWHSHHTVADGVTRDISPNGVGNLDRNTYPETFEEFKNFYNVWGGGDNSPGYTINPATGQPYPTQVVPRGDYSRVLSEFWADGPSSETPPGHWFTLLNTVLTNPLTEKRWEGQGPILDDLEYDVRAYLALGGAIHDAAISCWGAKGYYDSSRPIFAIRYMADRGQCSDPNLPNYHPAGLPLIPGYIEMIEEGDPLAGTSNENVGQVKLYTFMGPVAATGYDGVGWILAKNWWTFQKKTFVTPPFAGYYSGHSTYSRTGAEVLSRITGSDYFPGGMGEFHAPAGTYLQASAGPSVSLDLEWATYFDASDQCSISRIYGGLHPPMDDIPGRKVGKVVGPQAFSKANAIMNAGVPRVASMTPSTNVVNDALAGSTVNVAIEFNEPMNTAITPNVVFGDGTALASITAAEGSWITPTTYQAVFNVVDGNETTTMQVLHVYNAQDIDGQISLPGASNVFSIDTENPEVIGYEASATTINDEAVSTGSVQLDMTFSEAMNTNQVPALSFNSDAATQTFVLDELNSFWVNDTTFHAALTLIDAGVETTATGVSGVGITDENGNNMLVAVLENIFTIDTQNPQATQTQSATVLNQASVGGGTLVITLQYSELMNTAVSPIITFPGNDAAAAGLSMNIFESSWLNNTTFEALFDLSDQNVELIGMSSVSVNAQDNFGNSETSEVNNTWLTIDTYEPIVSTALDNANIINDDLVGTTLELDVTFDQGMNTSIAPTFTFSGSSSLGNTLAPSAASSWTSNSEYHAVFTIQDENIEVSSVNVDIQSAQDENGNSASTYNMANAFVVDTKNPLTLSAIVNITTIQVSDVGTNQFFVDVTFDEALNTSVVPTLSFPIENPSAMLQASAANSGWQSATVYRFAFDVQGPLTTLQNIDIAIDGALDLNGNLGVEMVYTDLFNILGENTVAEQLLGNVLVYPNPTVVGEDINIRTGGVKLPLQAKLFDMQGRVVNTMNIPASSEISHMSTSALSAGNYVLQLNTGNNSKEIHITLVK
jgi:hypothetical protein